MTNNKSKFFIFALLSVAIILSIFSVVAYANPATVNLGEAENFAVLSSTAITDSVPTATIITGDIGVSPAAATLITGLACTEVVGTIHVVSAGGETLACQTVDPAYLTPTVLEYEAAYTDAQGRTNPTATELHAGDLSGKTLTPGLYKWGTEVLINDGVTLNCQGNSNAVFIFQIAQDLTVGNGAIVTLTDCQAKNIFWVVAGQATLGTTSNVKGNILSQTAIVLNTGATLNGRALAQTAVTLDANAVTKSN